jgi:type I restriction enzyme, S subunit
MSKVWPEAKFGEFLRPNSRPYTLGAVEDANLVGMRLYGQGPFHREFKPAMQIAKKTHFVIKAGDVIYNKLFAWKGTFGVVPATLDGMFVSDKFPTYKLDRSKVDEGFLSWYFRYSPLWEQAQAMSTGSAALSKLTLNPPKFPLLTMPLPPLTEQRQVVALIEELAGQIQEARGLRRQAAEAADVLLTTRISALFDGDDCWKHVADAVSPRKGAVRSGPFGSQLLHEEFIDSGVAAIGTRDVQTNRFLLHGGWYVSPEKFEQFRRYQVFPGDVLCTIVGASIGRFCVVPENVPTAFTTKHIQALSLDISKAEPQYVSLMLNFHRRCRQSLFSQVEGSAQPSLNSGKILGTALPLPSLAEQQRIIADLDALQVQVDMLKRLQSATAAELDALLPAILDRAFKGELV